MVIKARKGEQHAPPDIVEDAVYWLQYDKNRRGGLNAEEFRGVLSDLGVLVSYKIRLDLSQVCVHCDGGACCRHVPSSRSFGTAVRGVLLSSTHEAGRSSGATAEFVPQHN